MKFTIILILTLLTGCTTVPVTVQFPDAPGASATVSCPALQQLPADPTLSNISQTIVINYTTYYECAVKLDAWQEWYTVQKHIFEKATK